MYDEFNQGQQERRQSISHSQVQRRRVENAYVQAKNQAKGEICYNFFVSILISVYILNAEYTACGINIEMWLTVQLGIYVGFTLIHMASLNFIEKQRRGSMAFAALDFLVLLTQTGWLIYGNILFYSDQDQCEDASYNLWMIMLLLIIIGYCQMLKCCCLSCFVCIFIPMLIYASRQQQRPNWAPASDGFIGNLVHTRFNINKDGEDKTCPICFEDFKENDQVIPLPCNDKHIFHDACITEWLKNNNACPLCKKPIDENALQQQKRQIDNQV